MPKTRVKKAVTTLKEFLDVPKITAKEVKPLVKAVKKKTSLGKKTTVLSKKPKSKKVPVRSEEPTVTLPPSASLRLLEKVNLYKIWYRDTLPLQVTSSARFFGYLFIGLGTLFAASSHLMHTDLPPGVAALVCSAGACEEVADEALPAGSPQITFLTSISKEIESDIDFVVKVDNAKNFKIILTNIQSGQKTELESTTQPESNNYQYRIATAEMSAGNYSLKAIVDNLDIEYVFSGPDFSYQPEESITEAVTVIEPVIDLEVDEDEESEATSTTSTTSATVSSTLLPDEQLPVSIKFEKKADASYLVITTGDFLPKTVNVYSRVDQSKSEVYLGQAQLVQNQWFFSLSAITLPQISQQFYASFEVDGVVKKTKAVMVPYTAEAVLTSSVSEDFIIKKRKVDLTLQALELNNTDRTVYYTKNKLDLRQENESQFVHESTVAEIDSVLETETAILDTYFFHYANAYLGGQSFLINLAKQELDNYTKLLANKIAENSSSDVYAPAIETVLSARFSKLTEIINTLEDKLVVETSTLINQDADSDGITDYDEITNFFTDPSSSDTDQDGVIDGVEILLFADPLTSDLKAFPELSQNRSVPSSEEVLSIIKSRAIIQQNDSSSPKQTQYAIEGRGIPNTFVYLLDKTSNTVGVIKTNASGEFFYTIEQPAIEEGATIQVALIDSNGEIISQSTEFEYTNQSNQLMAAVSDMLLGDEELSTRLTSFNILTGSIALVALGFILLLLAQSIKTRRRSLVLKDLDFAVNQ